MEIIQPDNTHREFTSERQRWEALFAGQDYYYGSEPGPVARRVVKYHKSFSKHPGQALDAGCGEGQDLLFLAQNGYDATGIEFTKNGAKKSQNLLRLFNQTANIKQGNLQDCPLETYDIVLAVNCLQFMGEFGEPTLFRLKEAVRRGGLIGISLFAREAEQPEREGSLWRITLPDLMAKFKGWQPIEAANLWQWNVHNNQPQAFTTFIARCL